MIIFYKIFIAEPALFWAGYFLKKVKIFPSERNSFLNLSAPFLNFSGDEGKIFTFKPAQKSAGSVINMIRKVFEIFCVHGSDIYPKARS
jgi:hypothetical protein